MPEIEVNLEICIKNKNKHLGYSEAAHSWRPFWKLHIYNNQGCMYSCGIPALLSSTAALSNAIATWHVLLFKFKSKLIKDKDSVFHLH